MAVAQEVSSTLKIKLLDGKTEVILRPLSIKTLRVFMKTFEKLKDAEVEDTIMDILVECAAVALQKQLPEQTKFLDDEEASRDDFEELVDMNIVSKVNEICGGISFDDTTNPNLQTATAGEDGQT